MNVATHLAKSLRALLHVQPLAALGTAQGSEPFVSMVPFAIEHTSHRLIIHVSTLAQHTQHMLNNPIVSLMVMAVPSPDVPVQAAPRVTIQGTAAQLDKSSADYEQAKTGYLDRFPQSLDLFGFTDFSLFAITPTSARFVAGFAQAMTLNTKDIAEVLS
ncbi:MAG: pyridoxamine 5'-phosphate oxidase family protein [Cytophagales bacterium]|nr:pyridoxamine 5'-phosphate oxidase family protein [Cytophagales bacterium]